MSCAPTDRLLQTLRVKVPGATDDMLNLQLFNTMDEFFRRTSAWRYVSEIELNGDTIEYGFGVPNGSTVVRLMSVTHNGIPVPSAQGGGVQVNSFGVIEPALLLPDGDAEFNPTETDLLPSDIFSYAIYRPEYISVNVPGGDDVLKYPLVATLALTMSNSCVGEDCGDWSVDEWMWDTYFHDWLDGTLAGMYSMPAKPWATPVHAQYHAKRFRNAMAMRKQEAIRGFNYNVPAWRFPRM